MSAAVLFDLDATALDRTASLKAFVQWQANGMLRGQVPGSPHFIERFLELDNNGKVWKDKVYSQLIDEFTIKHWTTDELLKSYLLNFCGFCKPDRAYEFHWNISKSAAYEWVWLPMASHRSRKGI